MKSLNILFIGLIALFFNQAFSQQSEHEQDIHKYLTYQAWELVKQQHPGVINSEMNLRIGHWQDGTLNGTGPWQKGKVVTGAYREDEEDVVYKYSGPFTSATHFWDGDQGDNSTFNPPPYTHNYENSYKKILAYWNGNVNNEAWLELGPFFYFAIPYYIKVKYYDLAEAYKNHSNFLVTHWYDISIQRWVQENPPVPVIPYLLKNSPGYSEAEAVALLKRVCWETAGRIVHHLGDAGVPAHAHNDPHPISDYFESIYIPDHFLEYTWANALNQGGLININNKQYPLRFALYTTNQISDRFKSDDACGDLIFPYPSQYSSDNYESILNPMYQSIYVLPCEGPESIANIIAQKSFVYTIRSIAGFLWYVYNRFEIQTQFLPVIQGFTKNLPDNTIYRGETLRLHCNASGSNLNYNWFQDVCDLNNWCTIGINGLLVNRDNGDYSITNHNFQNRWTCTFYDSLCNNNILRNNIFIEDPLHFYVGVKAFNQFGHDIKYYNMDNLLAFNPLNAIRPPDPPIVGCPILHTKDTNGFKCENNILIGSTLQENQGKDIVDKIVIGTKPHTDTLDNTLQFAITESSGDINYFEQFELIQVDHPKQFTIAITSNNDIAMLDLKNVKSPKSAEKSGTDIASELAYDSSFSKYISGEEKEIINAQFGTGFSDDVQRNAKDSVALIFDPFEFDIRPYPHPAAKREIGYISVTDTAGNKTTSDIEFVRRQRRSMRVIPVSGENDISRASMVFKEGFDLTYFSVAKVLYEGFKYTELELAEAENSLSGSVYKELIDEDKKHAELDSNSFIILKFKNSDIEIPEGWTRSYVLSVKGRTIEPEGISDKTLENEISENGDMDVTDNFSLQQNYPNPFNPATVINYSIPAHDKGQMSNVRLVVYDNLGKEVSVLVNDNKAAGNYTVSFDGKNLPSGIYYYKLTADNFTQIRKMILLK